METMSKEKETDAANVLSQMSQLVGSVSFDLSASLSPTEHEDILETETIGATCTLQPSNLDLSLFPLGVDGSFTSGRSNDDVDPCIAFDDSEHTYAVPTFDTSAGQNLLTEECMIDVKQKREVALGKLLGTKPATCEYCGKTFKRPYSLKIHLRSHSGERPHVCLQCGFSFTTLSDLKRHSRTHETGSRKSFKCPDCDRVFLEQASLTRHARIHKQKPEVFKCEICSKEFHRKDCYNLHVQAHSKQPAYKCVHCSRVFRYKNTYNRHLNNHSSKVYTCHVCGKEFRRTDTLQTHLKVHKDGDAIKKTKKSASLITTETDILDASSLLDCSADISSEHRYSMNTSRKCGAKLKQGRNRKRSSHATVSRTQNEDGLRHSSGLCNRATVEHIDMKMLDSFPAVNTTDNSTCSKHGSCFEALNSTMNSMNRISPVPILMSMAKSAAHLNKPQHNYPSRANMCASAEAMLSSSTNRVRKKRRKFDDASLDLFASVEQDSLTPSSCLPDAFISLLPDAAADIQVDATLIESANDSLSDAESTVSSKSADLCISFDSCTEESGTEDYGSEKSFEMTSSPSAQCDRDDKINSIETNKYVSCIVSNPSTAVQDS